MYVENDRSHFAAAGRGGGDIRLTIAPTRIEIRAALAAIRNGLTHLQIDPELLSRVEQAVAEVLNNIVIHAHRDRGDGRIEIGVRRVGTGLDLYVIDDGWPMPGGMPPVGRLPDLDVETKDLPEGGFGWFMIWQLVDGLSYRRTEADNRLRLWFEAPGMAKTGGEPGASPWDY